MTMAKLLKETVQPDIIQTSTPEIKVTCKIGYEYTYVRSNQHCRMFNGVVINYSPP